MCPQARIKLNIFSNLYKPELFHSNLASFIFYTEVSFPFHFPFHSILCPGCRFFIIIIVTFYPNSCSLFENLEVPDLEKIASASNSFLTLSLPSSLPLPTFFIKVLPLPQKINRFQLPLPLSPLYKPEPYPKSRSNL